MIGFRRARKILPLNRSPYSRSGNVKYRNGRTLNEQITIVETREKGKGFNQMKLSEAILKGCEIAPKQARGHLFGNGVDDLLSCAACVMGAAFLGLGVAPFRASEFVVTAKKYLPQLTNGIGYSTLACELIKMNDEKRMSRESIAADLAKRGF